MTLPYPEKVGYTPVIVDIAEGALIISDFSGWAKTTRNNNSP